VEFFFGFLHFLPPGKLVSDEKAIPAMGLVPILRLVNERVF
jgi:hypothetical protein